MSLRRISWIEGWNSCRGSGALITEKEDQKKERYIKTDVPTNRQKKGLDKEEIMSDYPCWSVFIRNIYKLLVILVSYLVYGGLKALRHKGLTT